MSQPEAPQAAAGTLKAETNPSSPSTADQDTLKTAIRTQVEFYFSPQNLASDSFLLSKMDADHFVPLSLIQGFGKIKALTTDPALLLASLEGSDNIELSADNTKVKRKEEQRRTRLILHDLPADTTKEELEGLFKAGGFEPTIKSDVNHCWFVSFAAQDTAAEGLKFVRTQKIHDKAIRARFKSEPLMSNIIATAQASPAPSSFSLSAPFVAPGGLESYGNQPVWIPAPNAGYYWDPYAGVYRQQDGQRDRGGSKKGPRKDGGGHRQGYGGKSKRGGRKGKARTPQEAEEQLRPSDFPPLPSGARSGKGKTLVTYDRQTLLTALQGLEVGSAPADQAQSFPFRAEPNPALENE